MQLIFKNFLQKLEHVYAIDLDPSRWNKINYLEKYLEISLTLIPPCYISRLDIDIGSNIIPSCVQLQRIYRCASMYVEPQYSVRLEKVKTISSGLVRSLSGNNANRRWRN